MVAGDRDHLRQAIANLVSNAVRHTPAGTAIEVSARADDGDGRRDRCGTTAAASTTTPSTTPSTVLAGRPGPGRRRAGLGLAIVAGIAHEHGGTATAANAEGGGALFTLRLPLGRTGDRRGSGRPFSSTATSGRRGSRRRPWWR